MKKIILFLAVCLLPALLMAKPAALADDYVFKSLGSKEGTPYLTEKIMKEEPLLLAVEVPNASDKKEIYEQYVQSLYDMWFNSLGDILRRANRPEFDDLLEALPEQVKINFVEENQTADLKFFFVPLQEIPGKCEGNKYTQGCLNYIKRVVYFSDKLSSQPGEVNSTHLHEVGHSLGLADQYYLGRNSNANSNYASKVHSMSIMNDANGPEYVTGITEDDADALVMAIDLALGNYERGGETGWKSLDEDYEQYYVHGKAANRPYSFYFDAATNTVRFTEYDDEGKIKRMKNFSFAGLGLNIFEPVSPLKVLRQDDLNRPIKEIGPTGEIVYTSYLYERHRKLFIKDEQVVRYEETMWNGNPLSSQAVSNAVSAGSADSINILVGFFGVPGLMQQAFYKKIAREDRGDFFYVATCTQKECNDEIKKEPPSAALKNSLQKKDKQKTLFEQLKNWLKDKVKKKS